MTKTSAYQEWIKSNFHGNSAKSSVELKINSLLLEAKQFTLPIKLTSVAKIIGIDPKPVYLDQPYDGSLVTIDNCIRIGLNLSYRASNRYSQRLRFTYAHELIHCFAYDFDNLPNRRIAPLPKGLEEEHLCNYGAAKLILPKKVLANYFSEIKQPSLAEKIKTIADAADCSLITVVIELISSGLVLPTPNKLYILSMRSHGYQNKGELKPRCLVGVYFDATQVKNNFLASNKGLESIKNIDDNSKPWSLIQFHQDYSKDYFEVKEENLVRMTDNSRFTISGVHVRLNDRGYVWSELSLANQL